VLENLPRSRPGRRSEKRSSKSAAAAASRAERTGRKAAKAPPGTSSRSQARPKPAAGPRRAAGTVTGEPTRTRQREPVADRGGDPVGEAIRAATSVAATGARVANGVARELLRRLPRP